MTSNLTKLYGLTPAIATPLDARGQFDPAAYGRLIGHILDAGVSGAFVLGVAGEYAAFDRQARRRILETAREAVGGRVPLIAGVFATRTEMALEYIADARAEGADYVLLTPPHWFRLTQAEIKDFYIRLAEEGGAPVIAYNCPLVNNQLSFETVAELASHPLVAGIKETSTQENLQRIWAAVGQRTDFLVMSGWEYLYLPAMSLGIRAFIMGGPGNLVPHWCVEVLRRFGEGDSAAARDSYLRLTEFCHRIYGLGLSPMSAIKAGLELLGLCQRYVFSPYRSANESEMAQIGRLLEEHSLLPAAAATPV
ncbi:MAG: dihydrodipicolinate synthase family protein [Acidobacteria bacterium]|nr:dihydrodipicolinate synthase family protein [Acidobacteriota bacterium]